MQKQPVHARALLQDFGRKMNFVHRPGLYSDIEDAVELLEGYEKFNKVEKEDLLMTIDDYRYGATAVDQLVNALADDQGNDSLAYAASMDENVTKNLSNYIEGVHTVSKELGTASQNGNNGIGKSDVRLLLKGLMAINRLFNDKKLSDQEIYDSYKAFFTNNGIDYNIPQNKEDIDDLYMLVRGMKIDPFKLVVDLLLQNLATQSLANILSEDKSNHQVRAENIQIADVFLEEMRYVAKDEPILDSYSTIVSMELVENRALKTLVDRGLLSNQDAQSLYRNQFTGTGGPGYYIDLMYDGYFYDPNTERKIDEKLKNMPRLNAPAGNNSGAAVRDSLFANNNNNNNNYDRNDRGGDRGVTGRSNIFGNARNNYDTTSERSFRSGGNAQVGQEMRNSLFSRPQGNQNNDRYDSRPNYDGYSRNRGDREIYNRDMSSRYEGRAMTYEGRTDRRYSLDSRQDDGYAIPAFVEKEKRNLSGGVLRDSDGSYVVKDNLGLTYFANDTETNGSLKVTSANPLMGPGYILEETSNSRDYRRDDRRSYRDRDDRGGFSNRSYYNNDEPRGNYDRNNSGGNAGWSKPSGQGSGRSWS